MDLDKSRARHKINVAFHLYFSVHYMLLVAPGIFCHDKFLSSPG